MQTIEVLGIDLGKSSCSLAGLDASGAVVPRRRMRRETVVTFAAGLSPCAVAMEACCGAHHLGRALQAPRPPGAADVARVRAALREGAEERRPRRGGDRRGRHTPDDALRRAEERGAAG